MEGRFFFFFFFFSSINTFPSFFYLVLSNSRPMKEQWKRTINWIIPKLEIANSSFTSERTEKISQWNQNNQTTKETTIIETTIIKEIQDLTATDLLQETTEVTVEIETTAIQRMMKSQKEELENQTKDKSFLET